ncbi:histidinol phosphatase [Aquimarina sp. ERC-38]|uniref:tyrosine-protein phosphatase n=1 Tax=Aquimarina sp. ERC-38 TaxID=2949996 RepID=UPI0022464B2F|nr:CpsB/CapC family capsule biosynthesis tyrosine phosphatase [Aquimarina sp. ERC-38]UZO80227.1 histidinol phosphatase [Aquimarina sp. ERC-38]
MFFSKNKNIPFKEILPGDYLDFHSHLLPGIDDGAKSLDASLLLIKEMERIGVKKIITTPHVMKDMYPNTTTLIKEKQKEVEHAIKEAGIIMSFHAAAEYMLDELFHTRLVDKDVLLITGDYLLVEMSTFNPPINLKEQLFDIKVSEYTPILAHPERYSFYFDDYSKYADLKDSGFFFQLNLLSVKGFYGEGVQKTAMKLLEDDMYDFAGSDIHNLHHLEVLERGFVKPVAKKVQPLVYNNSLLY